MPATINGIGTTYIGKSNHHVYEGTCEFCGQYGAISSYDTRMCFSVLFLPVVPLGQKHIFDQCSSCGRHRAMPLKKWHSARQEATEEAGVRYKTESTAENACHLISTSASYCDRGLFEMIKDSFANKWRDHSEVMATLASASDYFGELQAAVRLYERAVELQPNDRDLQKSLMFAYLDNREPESMARTANSLLETADTDELPLMFFVLQQLYALNRDELADRMAERMETRFPDLASNTDYKKLRKKKAAKLHKPKRGMKPDSSPLVRALPFMTVIAILSLGFAFNWYSANHREVFLINAMNIPQVVEVDGQEWSLPPLARRPINLSEGDHRVRLFIAGEQKGEASFSIHGSIGSRIFGDTCLILNPDRLAVLVKEEVYYSTNPATAPDGNAWRLCGETFYEFDDIDYLFERFPESIDLSSSTSVTPRQRVYYQPYSDYFSAIDDLFESEDPNLAPNFVNRMVELGCQDRRLLAIYGALSEDQEPLDAVREQLEADPDSVAWHRVYQDFTVNEDPEALLIEYQELHQQNPNHSGYAYLLGRIHKDPRETDRLIELAASLEPVEPYARYALAFDANARGDFNEALTLLEMALKDRPYLDEFTSSRRLALLGLKKYDVLLSECQAALVKNPSDIDQLLELVTISGQAGKPFPDAAIKRYMNDYRVDVPKEERNLLTDYLKWLAVYASGDVAAFVGHEHSSKYGGIEYQLVTNQLNETAEHLNESGTASDWLLLWLFAIRAQQTELADTAWDRGISTLSNGSHQERRILECLNATEINPSETLAHPEESAIYWLVLAERIPRQAEFFRERASRINVFPQYPRLAIASLLTYPADQ